MIGSEILKTANNLDFFCDIAVNEKEFFFTTKLDKTEFEGKIYEHGIDDFTLNSSSLKPDISNFINIAANSNVIDNFLFINRGFINLFAISNDKKINIFKGIVKSSNIENKNYIVIEFISHAYKLSHEIGDFFSKTCRAEFGDGFCKKDLSGYTFLGTIKKIMNRYQFQISTESTEFFENGTFKIVKNNQIFQSKILLHNNSIITLSQICPLQIDFDDEISLITSCDKSVESCKKFNNILNFRGEPFIG